MHQRYGGKAATTTALRLFVRSRFMNLLLLLCLTTVLFTAATRTELVNNNYNNNNIGNNNIVTLGVPQWVSASSDIALTVPESQWQTFTIQNVSIITTNNIEATLTQQQHQRRRAIDFSVTVYFGDFDIFISKTKFDNYTQLLAAIADQEQQQQQQNEEDTSPLHLWHSTKPLSDSITILASESTGQLPSSVYYVYLNTSIPQSLATLLAYTTGTLLFCKIQFRCFFFCLKFLFFKTNNRSACTIDQW